MSALADTLRHRPRSTMKGVRSIWRSDVAKVRVYELAKELGLTSKDVLDVLKNMGEFVRSASSVVEPPVERRLKERFARDPVKRQRPQLRLVSVAKDPVVKAPIVTNPGAGVDIDEDWFLQGLRQPRRQRREDLNRGARRTQPKRRSAEQIEAELWGSFLFDAEAADEWRAGGILQPELASRCVEAGLRARDLSLRVDGRRVGERLASGEHLAVVLDRLQNIGWKADGS